MSTTHSSLKLIYLQSYALKLIKHASWSHIDNQQDDAEQRNRVEALLKLDDKSLIRLASGEENNQADDLQDNNHQKSVNNPPKAMPSLGYLRRLLFALPLPAPDEQRRMVLLNKLEIILRYYASSLYRKTLNQGYTKVNQIKLLLDDLMASVQATQTAFVQSRQADTELNSLFQTLTQKITGLKSLKEFPILEAMEKQQGMNFENNPQISQIWNEISRLSPLIVHINKKLEQHPTVKQSIMLPNCLPFSLAPLLYYKKEVHFGLKTGPIHVENNDLIRALVTIFDHDSILPVEIEADTDDNLMTKIMLNLPEPMNCGTIEIAIHQSGGCEILNLDEEDALSERNLHTIALAAKALSEVSGKANFTLLLKNTDAPYLVAAAHLCLACQSLELKVSFPSHLSADVIDTIKKHMGDLQLQKRYRFKEDEQISQAFSYFYNDKKPSLHVYKPPVLKV